jgi:hypothetical protein
VHSSLYVFQPRYCTHFSPLPHVLHIDICLYHITL